MRQQQTVTFTMWPAAFEELKAHTATLGISQAAFIRDAIARHIKYTSPKIKTAGAVGQTDNLPPNTD
jgi:hypothetical protein